MKNADRAIRRLGQISAEARKGVGASLARSAVKLDAHAKMKIQGGSRSGRVYKRRSVSHQASAPGEYPKTDTGQFVSSLFFSVTGLTAIFGSRINYAKYLEFGTSRMKARPWLRPTFKANEAEVTRDVNQAIKEAIYKGSKVG